MGKSKKLTTSAQKAGQMGSQHNGDKNRSDVNRDRREPPECIRDSKPKCKVNPESQTLKNCRQ